MSLSPGGAFGPYTILAPLGAGGMGEVFRARDARLERSVAIKVLPREFSADRERLARFEQEARSASALNHPNIVTIYDIGDVDGVAYIAMELVEGRSLRELLAGDPLPLRKVLSMAVQIAEGLAAAHEAGIVHRDLKPDNLMLTKDGLVKLLDFGLAKLLVPALEQRSAAQTQTGTILGTVSYMSPEQASGRAVDFRSDQFSFGTILYEMAAGKKPFIRETSSETMAAIIREEPPSLASVAPALPAPLRWIVERCHSKDPDDRYASTRDLARDLGHLRDHVSEVSLLPSLERPARRSALRRVAPILAATGVLLLAAMAVFHLSRRVPASVPFGEPVRFNLTAPERTQLLRAGEQNSLALSPDGRTLAFIAVGDDGPALWVRALSSLVARRLSGTDGAQSPFWSPDGEFIAFFSKGKLQKIALSGNAPRPLCDVSETTNRGSWGSRGVIAMSELAGRSIVRVDAAGGQVVTILQPDPRKDEWRVTWPHFLPDGRTLLYFSMVGETGRLRALDIDTGQIREIGPIESRVEYSPPGYLVYASEGVLLAQPFDAKAVRFTGEAVQIGERVQYFLSTARAVFSVSSNGVLAFQSGEDPSKEQSRLFWFSPEGVRGGPVGPDKQLTGSVRLSPDGRRVATAVFDPRTSTADIWIEELDRGIRSRLTFNPRSEVNPLWSPDGRQIIYGADRRGPPHLFRKDVSGPGREEELTPPGTGVQTAGDWSRDGRFVAYSENDPKTKGDIWILPLEGDRKAISFRRTPYNELSPRFSPDGHAIAYVSDESGEVEVYVAAFPESADRWKVSSSGGDDPRWAHDGRHIYYVSKEGSVMVAEVKTTPVLGIKPARRLFEIGGSGWQDYDVAPDGRLLAVERQSPPETYPVTVVLGWIGEAEKSSHRR